MLKFVAIGDLHLDKKRLANLMGKQIATEKQLECVRKVIDSAIEQRIKHVFLLGDISDEPSLTDYSEQQLIRMLLWYDGKVNIHIVLGNHDIKQKDVNSLCKISLLSKTKKLKTVHVYDKHVVKEIDGIDVEFMPYPCSEPKRKNSLCVAHIEMKGAKSDTGYVSKDGVDVDISKGNVWVIGHLHTKQMDKNKHYYYPGTLYQTSFGEGTSKYYMVFDVEFVEKTRRLKYIMKSHHAPDSFRLETIELKKKGQLESIKKEMSDKRNKNAYYRVFHDKSIRMPLSFMRKFPQVVECKSFKTDEELKDLIVSESIHYKITDGLMDYLKRMGMSLAKRKRAKFLVKEAVKSISN